MRTLVCGWLCVSNEKSWGRALRGQLVRIFMNQGLFAYGKKRKKECVHADVLHRHLMCFPFQQLSPITSPWMHTSAAHTLFQETVPPSCTEWRLAGVIHTQVPGFPSSSFARCTAAAACRRRCFEFSCSLLHCRLSPSKRTESQSCSQPHTLQAWFRSMRL